MALVDVLDRFTDEMTSDERIDLAHQIGRENQARSKVMTPSKRRPLYARVISFPNPATRVGRTCRVLRSAHGIFSSAIRIPTRVLSFAANSGATEKPRAQTTTPALVKTGQPSRSHRLMRFSFNKRFSLCALRWPEGRNWSPARQLRNTRGRRRACRSSTGPVTLVSRRLGGQSMILKRKTQSRHGTSTTASRPENIDVLLEFLGTSGGLFLGEGVACRAENQGVVVAPHFNAAG